MAFDSTFLLAMASAFALVLAVEMPDKTMLSILVLTTRFRPDAVFAGVTSAFAVHVILAALFGQVIAQLPHNVLAATVAVLFAIGSFLLLRAGFSRSSTLSADASRQGPPVSWLRSAATSFGVLFVAEFGDASQLAVVGLTARFSQPVAVGLGAMASLVVVTAVAVVIGRKLRARIRPRILNRVAGFAFALFAVFAAAQSFA